jgi:hypothetical protein
MFSTALMIQAVIWAMISCSQLSGELLALSSAVQMAAHSFKMLVTFFYTTQNTVAKAMSKLRRDSPFESGMRLIKYAVMKITGMKRD